MVEVIIFLVNAVFEGQMIVGSLWVLNVAIFSTKNTGDLRTGQIISVS